MRRIVFAGITGITGIAGLASLACACELEHRRVEDTIDKWAKDKGVALQSISCPDRSLKKGDTFVCTARTDDGKDVSFDVEQTSRFWDISWKLRGAMLASKDLIEAMKKKLGASNVEVGCGKTMIVLAAETTLRCEIVVDGEEGAIVIRSLDADGNVEWETEPKAPQ